MAPPDQLTHTEPVERTLSAQTTVVAGPHENGNGFSITEIPDIAYLQEEFRAWLLNFLKRNNLDLDQAQERAIGIITGEFADNCYKLLDEHLFPNAINRYTEQDLLDFFVPEIEREFTANPGSVAIILDQAICYMMQEKLGEKYPGRIQEFSMSRPHGNLFTTETGGKVPRVGYPPLDEQVRTIKETVGDNPVFLVDDTTVEGGTLNTATDLLAQGGVRVLSPDHHMVYFLTRREESGMNRPEPPLRYCVKMINSRGSIELRECSVFGGAQEQTFDGNKRAYEVPAFPPFSQGHALRMAKNGMEILNLTEAGAELIRINREFLVDLAGILGKDPNEFTLASFNLLPADAEVEKKKSILPEGNHAGNGHPVSGNGHPRNGQPHHHAPVDDETIMPVRPFLHTVVNRSLQRHEDAPVTLGEIKTFCKKTSIVSYLDQAREFDENQPKRPIDIVCVDTDGTIAEMQPVDPEYREIGGPMLFEETKLGNLVRRKSQLAVHKLLRHNQLATVSKLNGQNIEQILPVLYRWGLEERAEAQFGNEALARIREIFVHAYGKGKGLVEAERFIEKMPLSYHALRHLTWDLPIEDIYHQNKEGQNFAMNVTRRGGKLVFITASPRIHAVKMLDYFGIMQNPGPNGFELYTVEDLYDPRTIPTKDNPRPTKLFVEGEKNLILNRLHEQNGTPRDRISMAGDVFRTEVQPALFNGYPARIVKDPRQLAKYAQGMRLPGDETMPPEELFREFHVEQKK